MNYLDSFATAPFLRVLYTVGSLGGRIVRAPPNCGVGTHPALKIEFWYPHTPSLYTPSSSWMAASWPSKLTSDHPTASTCDFGCNVSEFQFCFNTFLLCPMILELDSNNLHPLRGTLSFFAVEVTKRFYVQCSYSNHIVSGPIWSSMARLCNGAFKPLNVQWSGARPLHSTRWRAKILKMQIMMHFPFKCPVVLMPSWYDQHPRHLLQTCKETWVNLFMWASLGLLCTLLHPVTSNSDTVQHFAPGPASHCIQSD